MSLAATATVVVVDVTVVVGVTVVAAAAVVVVVGATTLRVYDCVVVRPDSLGARPSVAWIVKVYEPAVVGLPVIWPVEAFSDRPGGKVPLETVNVMGVTPVAFTVSE